MFDKLTIRFSSIGMIYKTKHECPACNKSFDNHNDYVNHFLKILTAIVHEHLKWECHL